MTIIYNEVTNTLKVYSDLIETFSMAQDATLTATYNDCCEEIIYQVDYQELTPTMDVDGYFITLPNITSPVNKVSLNLTTTFEQEETGCLYINELLPCEIIEELNSNFENLVILEALKTGNICSDCYCDDMCNLYKSLFNDKSNNCGCS